MTNLLPEYRIRVIVVPLLPQTESILPRTWIPVFVNDDGGHGETIPVLGLMSPHYSNIARNNNRGSNRAYHFFRGIPATGLIGACFALFFRITGDCALNPEQGMETGGKPALLFPIGRRIVSEMAWSRWKST